MSRMDTTVITMDTNEALARRIADEVRAAMADKRISQRDLAQATGLPLVTLNRRLTGVSKPFDVEELARVAGALGLSVVEIVLRAERAALRPAAA